MTKACLFDLDGVVFDTEPQYTIFWGGECRKYHPETPNLEHIIKGQTLDLILNKYFGDVTSEHTAIVERLDAFEQQMNFVYVEGFKAFISELRSKGILTAVVTSSNDKKMQGVYRQHKDFKELFDTIITADDINEGKPSPECYLTAAARLGVKPSECIVFEDSFNGLKSGRAAEMKVVGLSTTNLEEAIAPYSDVVIANYKDFSINKVS